MNFKKYRQILSALFLILHFTAFASFPGHLEMGGGYIGMGSVMTMDQESWAIQMYASQLLIDKDYKLGENLNHKTTSNQAFQYPSFPKGKEPEVIDYALSMAFASKHQVENVVENLKKNPRIGQFLSSEMQTQILELAQLEHDELVDKMNQMPNQRLNNILNAGVVSRINSFFDFQTSSFGKRPLESFKQYLQKTDNPNFQYLLVMNLEQVKEVLPYYKLNNSLATRDLLCQSIFNMNSPYFLQKMMKPGELRENNSMLLENQRKLNENAILIISKAKQSGVDFNQKCPSGFSIKDELTALANHFQSDPNQSAELKKKMTGLVGIQSVRPLNANLKKDSQNLSCDNHLQQILNLKNVCQLNEPLRHLVGESYKKSQPNETQVVGSSSQTCDLKAVYQVNRQLISGTIRVMNKSSQNVTQVKFEMPLKKYQQMIESSLYSNAK